MSYNRYTEFIGDEYVDFIPFIKIPESLSDKTEIYKLGSTRLDILSNKHYKDPNYGWLILLANADKASLEFNLPDGKEIRIPFPLETAIANYKTEVLKYKKYYLEDE